MITEIKLDETTSIYKVKYNWEYSKEDFYEWHHDVWWTNPRAHDRKLSVVIQLSPPESYTGGDFEFSLIKRSSRKGFIPDFCC